MRRKLSYDLEILYNKWSPIIISGLLVIYHTLCFLFPYDFEWIQYMCLPSTLTCLHMYNSRDVFKLCKVHRCFVNYVIGNLIACIIKHYWITAYMNPYWFVFVISGTILAMLIALFYYINHEQDNS